ncbi:MAG: MBL fold metallo-hydrolase [Planctomycetota bacterium]|jgi:metallo-beta-lactamase family protein
MKLTFFGAAGEVTGSQHLIEVGDRRILLDCGLFQGRRAETRAKNEQFHCQPRDLDAVILSHAHIDHSGNLPGLYRAGFEGPVFCTDATADVAELMLHDSARIQDEDARYLSKKLGPDHPPIEPLYTREHVEQLTHNFQPLAYHDWHELADDVRIRFSDAGHILGSAITELEVEEHGEIRRIVFTGDLGRRGLPVLRDPEIVDGCDVLITESTYGNRVHPSADDLKRELERILREASIVGGRVVIPAFSLGRTQHLVYFLNELFNEGRLPRIPVFVDSPLARRVTGVYRDHRDVMDDDVQELLRRDADPFGFPGLTYVGKQQESIELNQRAGALVIISASGMCESGRVVHHLRHAISNIENTIVMIGFQAEHTLGRRLVERQPTVRFFDHDYPLRANVEVLNGLSAHADALDFRWWFESMHATSHIGQAFIVHGERSAAQAQAQTLDEFCDEPPVIPEPGITYEV